MYSCIGCGVLFKENEKFCISCGLSSPLFFKELDKEQLKKELEKRIKMVRDVISDFKYELRSIPLYKIKKYIKNIKPLIEVKVDLIYKEIDDLKIFIKEKHTEAFAEFKEEIRQDATEKTGNLVCEKCGWVLSSTASKCPVCGGKPVAEVSKPTTKGPEELFNKLDFLKKGFDEFINRL